MAQPIEDARVFELDPQTSLVSGDVLLLDNPTLIEARKIDKDDFIASLPSPVQLAQDPPVDDGWRPVLLTLTGVNPPLVGAGGISYFVDLSSYVDVGTEIAHIEVFVEETGGVTPVEARLSPLDVYPTGVIVTSDLISGSDYGKVIPVALIGRAFYFRLISVGGSPATVNAELNFIYGI